VRFTPEEKFELCERMGLDVTTNETFCLTTAALHLLSGKWKLIVIANLAKGPVRFGELKRRLPQCTEKMMIQTLRELAHDDLLLRTQFPEVPPRVQYELTDEGRALLPILGGLRDWSKAYLLGRIGERVLVGF
jgi:DNA-binding HxlR family transcriptional regulator